MKRYNTFLAQIRHFKQLAKEKKIAFFRYVGDEKFSIEFADYNEVDERLLSLYLTSLEDRYRVKFYALSGGYGCFKISYTVVAETKEEAAAIARYMNSSKNINALTEMALETSLKVERLQKDNDLLEEIEKLGYIRSSDRIDLDREDDISSVLSVIESDMNISNDRNLSVRDRIVNIEENAKQNTPSPESSFWKLGDMIGALMGGFAKSMGAG